MKENFYSGNYKEPGVESGGDSSDGTVLAVYLGNGKLFRWKPDDLFIFDDAVKRRFDSQSLVVLEKEDGSPAYFSVEQPEKRDEAPRPLTELGSLVRDIRADSHSLTLRQAEWMQMFCENKKMAVPVIENYQPRRGLGWRVKKAFLAFIKP